MWTFILIAVGAILLTIGLVKLVDKYIPSKFKPLLTFGLWVLIAFFAYQTYMSIYTPILFNKEKEKRYTEVIKNLIDIRNSQIAFKQVNGVFTSNFDDLVSFIETGKYTIVQRIDKQVIDAELTRRFGVDTYKDIVEIDTLGFVSVKDSLFKNSTRYKTMMNVPVGKPGEKFKLEAAYFTQNGIKIPVFQASVKKDIILFDQDPDMVAQENQVVSVDGVNGDVLKVGSMTEVVTIGNWPKTYGANE